MKLDCIDVSKRFGSVTALDRLNLHLDGASESTVCSDATAPEKQPCCG